MCWRDSTLNMNLLATIQPLQSGKGMCQWRPQKTLALYANYWIIITCLCHKKYLIYFSNHSVTKSMNLLLSTIFAINYQKHVPTTTISLGTENPQNLNVLIDTGSRWLVVAGDPWIQPCQSFIWFEEERFMQCNQQWFSLRKIWKENKDPNYRSIGNRWIRKFLAKSSNQHQHECHWRISSSFRDSWCRKSLCNQLKDSLFPSSPQQYETQNY